MSELQEFARRIMLSSMSEPERIAYIEILKGLQRDTHERPKYATDALYGFFGLVMQHVKVENIAQRPKDFAAMVILSLYFQHQGDWNRMIADFERPI